MTQAQEQSMAFVSETVVRISQGFFEAHLIDSVKARLEEGRATLEPALRALRGLLHYYVAVDAETNSMVNVSMWESLTAAKKMDTLKEMAAQRDIFINLGVKFQPIRNYSRLWSIEA
jgi:hypothetical protein